MAALKICGITKVDQALTIASLGVDYLGFVCVKSSPRYREPEIFASIRHTLSSTLDYFPYTVGVFANVDLAELERIQNTTCFDILQLHGQESPEFCQCVKQRFPLSQVWKAFRIRNPQDLLQVKDYEAIVDKILLDAYHPQLLGGTGETIDWSILSDFQPKLPWFLAGGLSPENVSLALQYLSPFGISPFGIDVSSGVERSPGDKDLDRVRALMMSYLKT